MRVGKEYSVAGVGGWCWGLARGSCLGLGPAQNQEEQGDEKSSGCHVLVKAERVSIQTHERTNGERQTDKEINYIL